MTREMLFSLPTNKATTNQIKKHFERRELMTTENSILQEQIQKTIISHFHQNPHFIFVQSSSLKNIGKLKKQTGGMKIF